MVLLPHGPDWAVQGQLAVAIPDSRGHGGTSRAPTPELLWVVAYKFWFCKSMLKEMWHFMLQSENVCNVFRHSAHVKKCRQKTSICSHVFECLKLCQDIKWLSCGIDLSQMLPCTCSRFNRKLSLESELHNLISDDVWQCRKTHCDVEEHPFLSEKVLVCLSKRLFVKESLECLFALNRMLWLAQN